MLVSSAMMIISCAGGGGARPPEEAGKLPPCPESPNCVSSDAPPGSHFIAPFLIVGDPVHAWQAVVRTVSGWPRTRVVAQGPDFLEVECRTALLRFVDDLELRLRAAEGQIAVRSASRLGWSDMGVNRKRVESLRAALEAQGVVR